MFRAVATILPSADAANAVPQGVGAVPGNRAPVGTNPDPPSGGPSTAVRRGADDPMNEGEYP